MTERQNKSVVNLLSKTNPQLLNYLKDKVTAKRDNLNDIPRLFDEYIKTFGTTNKHNDRCKFICITLCLYSPDTIYVGVNAVTGVREILKTTLGISTLPNTSSLIRCAIMRYNKSKVFKEDIELILKMINDGKE